MIGGDGFAVVLDFECLSRPRSAMETMGEYALGRGVTMLLNLTNLTEYAYDPRRAMIAGLVDEVRGSRG
jgi:hypothetical protein